MSGGVSPNGDRATHEPSPDGLGHAVSVPNAGRVFVCGDIHGCLDQLERELLRVNFDKSKDRLFALGDLVDRGPKSADCVRLLREPWFHSVKGNHEVLMEEAHNGNAQMHVINGGGWFASLPQAERDELVALVRDLPVAATITTPSGRKIGLVHAEPVGNDWQDFMARIDTPQVQDFAMWTRDRVRKANFALEPVRGVDMVYMGHTPLREPIQSGNMRWIDTGCFATGNLTVEELL